MYDERVFRARVDAALDAFLTEETEQVVALHEALAPVADQLRRAVAGGKRLRAAFCYWGWRAAWQPDSDAVIRAAAAMELVHAAALVHDDIIDDSPTRRGEPAAHVALRAAGTGLPRDDHGTALAILAGDMLMAWASHLFLTCGLPQAYLGRARNLWIKLARELVAGECLEILNGGRPQVGRAVEIIRLKTAKYTVERPLHLGGLLGGAPRETLAAFTAYGVPLGEAFQLRDDLLGVFGDPARTGKSNLDDLRGRKPTALLAAALAGAGETDRKELERLLGDPGLDAGDLDAIQGIMRRAGARDHVETMIEERAASALGAIERTRMPPDAARALADLVAATTTRDS
ncbi:polyprenyl synthetase family protein [Microtetraspora sp. NBRC 13810]|uniref:polyprenyl synthetase family protein n=1 Tax=Microtetraspora sp. NBRC 13810 TaxID=3030990 RepID=UPI002553D5F2|nr:polyprenyl synthetase family protein [Microtetraspora sp. NBRC 13810]